MEKVNLVKLEGLDDQKLSPNSNTQSEFVYSLNDKPYGKSWEDWTTEWWKWILSLPKKINPGIDETGEKLQIDPHKARVLFLPGTFGGFAERFYRIPSRAMLLPVINFITSFSEEPQIRTELGLIERAKNDIDDISNTWATVDGVNILVKDFRVRSSTFILNLAKDNVIGIRPGLTKAAHDGYWLFLRPFEEGKHVVRVFGSCSSGRTKVDVVLHLDVYSDHKK
jgi:hypothetical protein